MPYFSAGLSSLKPMNTLSVAALTLLFLLYLLNFVLETKGEERNYTNIVGVYLFLSVSNLC